MNSVLDRAGNLADLLRAAAGNFGRRAALITVDGQRSWAELDAAADAGARALGELRLPRGARVVVGLPTGSEIVATLFAVARAGLVAVPVGPGRAPFTEVISRVGADLLITDFGPGRGPGDPGTADPGDPLRWDTSTATGWWTHPASDHGELPAAGGGEDLAQLARAASSDRPVMLSHRAVLSAVTAIVAAPELGLRADDRVVQVLPLYHPAGWIGSFLPLTKVGAAAVLPELPRERGGWIEAVLATVRQRRVTVIPGAPSLYRRLRTAEGVERALATVRLMSSGASPLDREDFAAVRALTGTSVREGYGISEAAAVVASTLMTATARPGSVGLPFPGVEVMIVEDSDLDSDPDEDAEIPVGTEPADSPAPAGSASIGSVPDDPAQNDPAQNDPAQNGPAQNGPAQNGPAQNGPAQNGPAQNGPAQNGPAQNGPVRPDPRPQRSGAADPAVESPAVESAAVENPAAENPAAENPAAENPAAQDLGAQEASGVSAGGVTAGIAADDAGDTEPDAAAAETAPGPTGIGEVGPIAVRGATLFSGYWPDGSGGPGRDGWFVTGDVGYLDDFGELHLVDRAAEALVVAGFTVYPREVEDVLTTHPYIRDAAVVGVPGRLGEGMLAVLVGQRGTHPTRADVEEFVANRLPPFKRPTRYRLVERLPRTEVGRIDRAAVRREYLADPDAEPGPVRLTGGPAGRSGGRGGSGEPPRSGRSGPGTAADEELF